MDSLLANYASSEEEEEQPIPPKTTSSSSSLPQPKSSSLFQSLPHPKQSSINPSPKPSGESVSLFSSLPKPKSQIQQPKKVIQFKPPIIPLPKPTLPDDDDDEDEEEEERNRRRKLESSIQAPSVKSFLSTIPAPRNTATLGVQSGSGSGRRSIIETEAPAPAPPSDSGAIESNDNVPVVDQNAGDDVNYDNYSAYQYGADHNSGSGYFVGDGGYGNYGSGVDQSAGFQPEGGVAGTASYGNDDGAYTSYGNSDGAYANYGAYGDYGNNWVDGSATVPEAAGVSESAVRIPRKRGRNEIPEEIIEVKQDELIKNRPREDQVKLTGIAFGPSYQPVSAKGKPTKLHKRKHQIGSLYFDMRQNEMKLAERRAKGMLTKAETQAKYGW